jgi:hypothetical protein
VDNVLRMHRLVRLPFEALIDPASGAIPKIAA